MFYKNESVNSFCELSGLEGITFYSFRRSWATIANNDLGASIDQVGFCLVHAPKDKITDGYFTRKDFSSVDKLKDRVIKYVFVNRVVKKRKLQKIKRGK